jgi:hypothetical protein
MADPYFERLRASLVERRDAFTKAIEALDVALGLDMPDPQPKKKAAKRNERTNERTKQRARHSGASEPP